MPRDNRSDNRHKAKEAGNENKAPDGRDFSDIIDMGDGDEEEEDVSIIENQTNEDDEESENASEGEAEKKADTTDVNKEGEAEGEKKEDGSSDKSDDDKGEKVGETAEEKTLREAKEKEEKPAPIEKKPEPTPEELAAAEAKKAESETPKTLTDEEAATLFNDWQSATVEILADHHYKLTEEDVAVLNENPAAYIPRAMARVYIDSISASFQQFANYLPKMVFQVLEQREKIKEQEGKFFSAWPNLAEHEKGRDTVYRLGAAYRQQNPSASMEDFINEVGAQAMVALRLTPKNGHNTDNEPEKKSFKPVTGGGGEPPPKQKPTNVYDQMAQDFGFEADVEDVDDS